MAASISLRRVTGAGAGTLSADIAGGFVRHDGRDAADDDSEFGYPVVAPTVDQNSTYYCVYQLYCDVAPDNLVSNFRLYSVGVNTLGDHAEGWVCTDPGYYQATGVGSVGGSMAGPGGPPNGVQRNNWTAHTAGAPRVIPGSTSVTGPFGDYIYTQIYGDTEIEPGATGEAKLYIKWDET